MFIPRVADAGTCAAYSKELGDERFAKLVLDLKADLKTDAVYYGGVTIYPMHEDSPGLGVPFQQGCPGAQPLR